MEAIVERCCGVDVHQALVVACALVGEAGRKPHKEVRTFGTMRRELEELARWLGEHRCTHVAMESTGVYWMPTPSFPPRSYASATVLTLPGEGSPSCSSGVAPADSSS